MAKEIKAIKCPQCGSTDKTEIRTDFYRCNSCQTEYFLDDDDVTINYNHNYNHNNRVNFDPNANKALKITGIVIGVIFFLIILTNVLSALFRPSRPDSVSTYAASSAEKEEDKGYSASRYQSFGFIQPGTQKPILLLVENRRYNSRSSESKEGTYLAFYDPIGKKLLSEEKVSDKSLNSSELKFRTFSDGNTYFITDKSALMALNKETFKLSDAGKRFFNAKPELQVGVATLDFMYDNKGDGLILLTNDGKKRHYYPLVQQLFTEENYYNAQQGFKTLLPGAKNKTIHLFTRNSSDYPEEKLQLLQVIYKDNGGGPKDVIDNVSWGKDYGGSGIFTERDPYAKVLIGDYNKQRGRVISWKDITPGRLYFSPNLVFDDGHTLIISFKADANPKSGYKLQQLNATTGAVEWTVDMPGTGIVNTLTKFDKGYFGTSDGNEILTLDFKGNVTTNFKLD